MIAIGSHIETHIDHVNRLNHGIIAILLELGTYHQAFIEDMHQQSASAGSNAWYLTLDQTLFDL